MKLILLIISIVTINFSQAQDKAVISEEFTRDIKKSFVFIEESNNYLICFKNDKKGGAFLKFNKSVKLQESYPVDLDLNKFTRIKKIRVTNNEIHIFTTFKNEKTKEKSLIVFKYDKKNLNLIEKKEIHKFIYTVGKPYTIAGEYHFLESEDKSRTSFFLAHPSFHITSTGIKTDPFLKCTVLDFDSNYKIISENNYNLRKNNQSRFVLFIKGLLSNTGEVYLTYEDNSTKAKESYMITANKKLVNLSDIMTLTELKPTDYSLFLGDSDKIFALGYSITPNSDFNIFYIDKNGKREETLFKFNSIKNEDGLFANNQKIHSIHKTADGFILCSEFNSLFVSKVSKVSIGSNYPTTTLVDNEFGNILITKFNNNGEIIWNKIIEKKQRTSDTNGSRSSFSVIIRDKHVYFLYNDLDIKELKEYQSSQTKLTKLDLKTGEQSTKTLINDFEFNYSSVPNNSYSNKNSSNLYFTLQFKKNGYLARVKLY